MFKLKHNVPNDFYKYCYSEYLIEKYETDYFNFGIDIGACGVVHKWHINHMAKDNPNTNFYGFEPDEKFFNIINNECSSLSNVFLYKKFFGRDISLKDLINNNNLDINKKWFFSCDCEGDEKYLFLNNEELDILKTAEHIAFEIHPKMANIEYDKFLKYFIDNFNDTHKIIRTYHGGGGEGVLDNSSFILVKYNSYETVIKKSIDNFKYNWCDKNKCMVQKNTLRKEHHLKLYN